MSYEIDLVKAEDDFRAKLLERGILAPSPLPIAKFTRCPVESKPRGRDGAFIWFDDGLPAGGFQNHTDGIGWENWHASGMQNLSDAERSAHKARVQAAREKHDADEKRKAANAARRAQAIIDASHDPHNDHPYAVGKLLVLPATVREIDLADAERILGYPPKYNEQHLQGRLLVVPVYIGGKLSTVEMIDESGRKSAIYGGTKTAGYWATADLPEGDGAGLTIIIGEGMATVISATMATGHFGVSALCCGNLMAVGKTMRQRYPRSKIVFVADLGIGVKKSTEAACAVDGYVAIPNFGEAQ
jgi:putative DNA primase/helicase